jgi:hypothetical protein
MVTNTAWYQHIDQWNKDPEINPHEYSYLTFNKVAKTIPWEKDNLFSSWC